MIFPYISEQSLANAAIQSYFISTANQRVDQNLTIGYRNHGTSDMSSSSLKIVKRH